MKLKHLARRTYWILCTQFGLNLRRLSRSIPGLLRYCVDYVRFRSRYSGPIELVPCLHDWWEEGGNAKGEYFWQDLVVARMIFAAGPCKHVDVGSRIDGFVAHVASFREIEVLDIRPVTASIPGVIFRRIDCMKPMENPESSCDSLSCLHTLEHFGLGRYGDPLDADGYIHGFAGMASMLEEGGTFYLSVPIGAGRVEFNANRVFDPHTICELATKNGLVVQDLITIATDGKNERIGVSQDQLKNLSLQRYALGLFVMCKETRTASS